MNDVQTTFAQFAAWLLILLYWGVIGSLIMSYGISHYNIDLRLEGKQARRAMRLALFHQLLLLGMAIALAHSFLWNSTVPIAAGYPIVFIGLLLIMKTGIRLNRRIDKHIMMLQLGAQMARDPTLS